MTLDEMSELIEQQEEALNKKKEDIFNRVLISLVGSDNKGTSEGVQMMNDAATTAFRESLHAKELKKAEKEKLKQEMLEREQLQAERERLRNRFAPNSIGR